MQYRKSIWWSFPAVGLYLSISVFLTLIFIGCDGAAPLNDQIDTQSNSARQISEIVMRTQDSLTTAILGFEEIVGIATVVSDSGEESLLVLAKTARETWPPQKKELVPSEANGIPVRIIVTGEIYAPVNAQGAGAMVGAQEFNRPVPIGVSTSASKGPTGSIGARVTSGSTSFALSNNHVFASMNAGAVRFNPSTWLRGRWFRINAHNRYSL